MSIQAFLTVPLSLSFPSLSPPTTTSSTPHFPKPLMLRPSFSLRRPITPSAAGSFYPNPSDDDPPEAPEDTAHGVSKFGQIQRQAARARKLEEEDFQKNRSVFLDAIKDVEDAPDNDDYPTDVNNSGDDLFGEIDKAIAQKRKEFVKQGLLEPNPPKKNGVKDEEEGEDGELDPEEVVDLEEIDELRGLRVVGQGEGEEGTEEEDYTDDEVSKLGNNDSNLFDSSSFDIDFDSFGTNSKVRIVEPKFKMTLAELLDESKVVPISVYGNLEVEISGIEHDSRLVNAGDLFVCCVGSETEIDGHLYLSEADKRGSVAVVASKEIAIEETLGCKALVLVEDTIAALPALAAAFLGAPRRICRL